MQVVSPAVLTLPHRFKRETASDVQCALALQKMSMNGADPEQQQRQQLLMDAILVGKELEDDFDDANSSGRAKVDELSNADTNEGDDDDDDDDGTDEDDDDDRWPCSTVLVSECDETIGEAYVKCFCKYVDKPEHRERLFKRVEDETAEMSVLTRRSKTLQALFSALLPSIDTAMEAFMDKYSYFSFVSTRDDFSLIELTEGDVYGEHIECLPSATATSVDSVSEPTPHRLCVYVIIDAPTQGGEIEFLYQGARIPPEPGMILVFPACPLHPLRIAPVIEGRLLFAIVKAF